MMRTALVVLEALLAVGASARPAEIQSPSCRYTAQWPRWENVKYAFIFGDSYTQTGFDYTLAPAPSPSNPLGNPKYPGYTSSNGPNWVDFLTIKHNASLLQTYNLAYGGATVDSALVKPWKDTVLSLKDQVQTQFVPGYVDGKAAAPLPAWHGNNSLFAIWIGINDVGNSYWGGPNGTKELNGKIFAVYEGLVNTLYDAGARNFAFINVPPIDRSPLTVGQGKQAVDLEKADIASWNGLVGEMAGRLKGKRQEANAWVVDANKVFGLVMDNPASYQETAGLKNTTGFCEAYKNGTPKPDTFDPSCGVPVNQYLWLNDLHPTYPIHDVVALEVASTVARAPNVCPDKPASTVEQK